MNGKEKKACVFGGFILVAYGIYLFNNPTADGIVFGSVMAMLAAIGGYAARGVIENNGHT